MRTRIELGVGIACLVAALIVAGQRHAADSIRSDETDRNVRSESTGDARSPDYPAKSSRRRALELGSARSRTSADHLSVARALIEQKHLEAAHKELELAVAIDDSAHEAQFLRDTISEAFRPMASHVGLADKFWQFQIEESSPFARPR